MENCAVYPTHSETFLLTLFSDIKQTTPQSEHFTFFDLLNQESSPYHPERPKRGQTYEYPRGIVQPCAAYSLLNIQVKYPRSVKKQQLGGVVITQSSKQRYIGSLPGIALWIKYVSVQLSESDQ